MPKSFKKTNRIWIELELPENDKEGHTRAILLSSVLHHLGVKQTNAVFWFPEKKRYCFTIDEGGSFVEATDNGHWYNLDYLAESTKQGDEHV